ncbi:uncharacterized protein BYT42DRAFT_614067 [Radiomyces spectabilis]|uniref:uncharacterized protein n=1 Tax=Radiomyces spectabilis TaxID=64574 RepID=UPI00221F1FEC|nr:uncharacterized protein BYT42DRAFT_614067 [Radiomyces spectabilis]KAI8379803.1 hypothetical protein BYT42DRAFT_614067 [Radiomyces spectabilis]
MSNIEDDEEDYMSSRLLEQASEYEKQRKDTTYTERRKQQLREQQKKGYIKPRKQLEDEARQEGLKKTLDPSNKGAKMLMKMGFKHGMALGKETEGALIEPIAIEQKLGRSGLGMATSLKRAREEEVKAEEEHRKRTEIDPDDFREAMAARANEARLSRRIHAAAVICERLDQVKSNILWTLLSSKNESQLEGRQEPTSEDDEDDQKEAKREEEPIYPPEEVEALKSLKLDDQLQRLVEYLRNNYLYCFWCGAQYADEEDLKENCPGSEEDDH